MIQTFTPNDILASHTGELPKEDSNLLKLALTESETLSDFESTLSRLESLAPELLSEPSDLPIKGIMAFVEKLDAHPNGKINPPKSLR
ncbi:MAG TPA: hypothetical protein PKY12_01245 [Catalimonadaceae bacterium]|jgi:hypothetical protein|nr:hypothetical protein [Catalimonadaceae bacterium]